jgi:hypothetical protein
MVKILAIFLLAFSNHVTNVFYHGWVFKIISLHRQKSVELENLITTPRKGRIIPQTHLIRRPFPHRTPRK